MFPLESRILLSYTIKLFLSVYRAYMCMYVETFV